VSKPVPELSSAGCSSCRVFQLQYQTLSFFFHFFFFFFFYFIYLELASGVALTPPA
jgi:hypothetical protein